MNRILDLALFAFVGVITFMIFHAFEGWKAYGSVALVWGFYLASYLDDTGAG